MTGNRVKGIICLGQMFEISKLGISGKTSMARVRVDFFLQSNPIFNNYFIFAYILTTITVIHVLNLIFLMTF